MKLKKRNRVRGENPLLVRKNYYPRKASPPSVMAKRSCGVMITNIQHRCCFSKKAGFGAKQAEKTYLIGMKKSFKSISGLHSNRQ